MSRGKSGSPRGRLSSKIFLTMGGIIFLFVIIIGFLLYMQMMQSGTGSMAGGTSPISGQMKTALQELQKLENRYLLQPYPGAQAEHNRHVGRLLSLAGQLSQNAGQTGEKKNAAALKQITDTVHQLDTNFNELTQALEANGLDGKTGLQGELAAAGKQLEETVSRNEAGELALIFLRLRRHQEEYLGNGGSIDLQNLRNAVKDFSRLLMDTRIETVEAQMLRKGIREYNSALDRYQAVSLATSDPGLADTLGKEQERQTDAMRNAVDNLETVIDRISVPQALAMVHAVREQAALYRATGDPEHARRADENLDSLISRVQNSPILQTQREQVLDIAAAYRTVFHALVQQDEIIKEHTAGLHETSSSLETLINSVKAPKGGGMPLPLAGNLNGMIMIAAGAALAVILLGLFLAASLGRSISSSLADITSTLRFIDEEKDFSIRVPVTGKNEIGALAEELNAFLQQYDSAGGETKEGPQELTDTSVDLAAIGRDLQDRLENIGGKAASIEKTASGQREMADGVAASVNQLSAAAESLRTIYGQSDEQNQLITDAVEHIGRSVESTVQGIKAITQSSSQITDIITLSTEIAEQTNLLALNASVKAARAGSHGKEFAVIADEISKLAQRSEEIAREAGRLTDSLAGSVDEAVSLGDDAKKSLDQVHEAGRINLEAAAEMTTQTDRITSAFVELEKLADSLTAAFREIDTEVKEQQAACIAAEQLIRGLSGQEKAFHAAAEERVDAGEETAEEDLDAELQQAVSNIAVSMEQQEEEEPGEDMADFSFADESDEEPESGDKEEETGENREEPTR